MITEQVDLIAAFQSLEDQAKDLSITDEQLTDNLSRFLQDNGYMRTPYDIHFEGFFRARTKKFTDVDEACSKLNNVKELGAPEHEKANSQRCNATGRSVFYCSTETGVPIFEVKPEKGQFLVVTVFWPKYTDKLHMKLPIIGAREIKAGLEKSDPRDWMVHMLKDDIQFKREHNRALEIDTMLAKLFVTPVSDARQNKHIYRLTTAFYNGLVKYGRAGDFAVNSMIYPSVESDISGYNVVIEKDFAEENLMVGAATLYEVTNVYDKIKPKLTFLRPLKQTKHISQEDGEIIWEKAERAGKLWPLKTDDRVHHHHLNKFTYPV